MNGSRSEAMLKVQRLSFMKAETELFLDTHPECQRALEFYHKILPELDAAMLEYRAKYGPITASESSTERWDWVDTPWPWQTCTDEKRIGGDK